MVGIALRAREGGVDCQPVLGDDVRDDGVAVADRPPVVDHIGELPARRRRRIERVLVPERHAGEPQEREHLEPVAVVVRDAVELRPGIKRKHGFSACI